VAVQATGIFYSKPSHLYSVQDIDDKNDNESKEEKEEGKEEGKEFLLQSCAFRQTSINKAELNLSPVIIFSSPLTDHLTPPPDNAFHY